MTEPAARFQAMLGRSTRKSDTTRVLDDLKQRGGAYRGPSRDSQKNAGPRRLRPAVRATLALSVPMCNRRPAACRLPQKQLRSVTLNCVRLDKRSVEVNPGTRFGLHHECEFRGLRSCAGGRHWWISIGCTCAPGGRCVTANEKSRRNTCDASVQTHGTLNSNHRGR